MRSARTRAAPHTTLPDWSAPLAPKACVASCVTMSRSPIVTVVTVARSSASGSSLPVLAVSSSSRINARSSLIVLVTSLKGCSLGPTY